VHPDPVLDVLLARHRLEYARAKETGDQQPVRGENSVHLRKPLAPEVADVSEHRHRPDQIEVAVVDWKRRSCVAAEAVQWRFEMRPKPVDALSVDVTAPQFAGRCLRKKLT
jgi:hypothetical protein